jgi:beta-glucosidase
LTTPAGPTRNFPRDFVWGAATAAHQIEGNNVNSDLWFLENIEPTIFVERSGDACDSYHRYEEDIAFLAETGLNCYRFSVEWARIEPSPGHYSPAELDHYKRMIECCRAHGVAPAVTFFHASAPRWFAMAGGWLNPEAPDLFSRYCARTAGELADGIAFAFTINEPQVGKTFRCIPGAAASYFAQQDARSAEVHAHAATMLGTDCFVTMDHPDIDGMTPQLLAGHELAYAAIKAVRSDLPTGVTLSVTDFQPGGEGSTYREIRERAYRKWLDAVVRSGDFVGLQSYRTIRIAGTGKPFDPPPALPFVDPDDPIADMQRPEALRNTVEYVYKETGKPVLITENGLETEDDERRVWYIGQVLAGLHQAMEGGAEVVGYIHWTLLDNFEWTRGYGPKFGLASVDRTTFVRTPKASADRLGAIARRNAL